MKVSKKSFSFLAFTVEVWLTDSPPEGFREESLAGVFYREPNDDIVRIWFKGLVNTDTVVHECWHLFIEMLSAMDNKPHYFSELYDEIYAYFFHTLVSKVLETVTSMKEYKKFWENNRDCKEE